MKSVPDLLSKWFSPKTLQGLDIHEIMLALSDSSVRSLWILDVFEELQRLNLEIDNRLLSSESKDITDLAARRKAYQDVLVSVLAAKRRVKNNNPQSGSGNFDLDSVTVLPA